MPSNIQNVGGSNTPNIAPTFGGGNAIVRVASVVENDKHPIFNQVPYNPVLLGMIFYLPYKNDHSDINDITSLPTALPLGNLKTPLIGECVPIVSGPSSNTYTKAGGSKFNTSTYYGDVIPVFNNPTDNALPREVDLSQPNTNANSQNISDGASPNQQQAVDVKYDEGNYFKPNSNVRKLQRNPGDTVIEGRNAQSVRMTTEEDGSAGLYIRVGQSTDQTGATAGEDINGDASSIYLLEDATVNNLILSSTNFESVGASYTPKPQPTQTFPPSDPIPVQQEAKVETSQPFASGSPEIIQETETPTPAVQEPTGSGDPFWDAVEEQIESDTPTFDIPEGAGGGPDPEDAVSSTEVSNDDNNPEGSGIPTWASKVANAEAKDDAKGTYPAKFPGTNVPARRVYAASNLSENFISKPLSYTQARDTLINPQPKRSGIKAIVLHFTAGTPELTEASTEGLVRDHLRSSVRDDWSRFGYHYIVGTDGLISGLMPENIRSNGVGKPDPEWAAQGYKNNNTININFCGTIGDLTTRNTKSQLVVFAKLLRLLMKKYPTAKVIGHNQITGKACPGFYTPTFLELFGATDRIWIGNYTAYDTDIYRGYAKDFYNIVKDAF